MASRWSNCKLLCTVPDTSSLLFPQVNRKASRNLLCQSRVSFPSLLVVSIFSKATNKVFSMTNNSSSSPDPTLEVKLQDSNTGETPSVEECPVPENPADKNSVHTEYSEQSNNTDQSYSEEPITQKPSSPFSILLKQKKASSSVETVKSLKQRRQNVVLPSYEPQLLPNNSVNPESAPIQFLQRALHRVTNLLLWRPHPLDYSRKSVFDKLLANPHNIKRFAVIGIHGWFPGRLIQRGNVVCRLKLKFQVVGEPTGTSSRFSEKMGTAIKTFFQERYNINIPDSDITLIPLEGEGIVERRVEILYRHLTESVQGWKEAVGNADMVFISTHSQGTPVSILLLSRLIKEGIINPRKQKLALLAMAGISHGPFPTLKSSMIVKYFEADAARELFEFNNPTSTISVKYTQALGHTLDCGLRLVAVGSWYDQVVPLYSGIMHGFHHPNIYRGLYIDGADYIPDFLSHLVVFALKLRNCGLKDYNLLVHISQVLAGNLYGFGTQGHSALYEELNTYLTRMSIAWAMGSKPAWTVPPKPLSPLHYNSLAVSEFHAPTKLNPYYLPWIFAKLQSDISIKANKNLSNELSELLLMFKDWDPSSKLLKELKYRLEPIRSRL